MGVRAPAPGLLLRHRPVEDASPRQQGPSFITHLSSHLRLPPPHYQKLPRSSPSCWVQLERFYIFSRCFCRPSSLQSNSLHLVRHNTRRITLRELCTGLHCESADCLRRFTLPARRAAHQTGGRLFPGRAFSCDLKSNPACICTSRLDRPLRS